MKQSYVEETGVVLDGAKSAGYAVIQYARNEGITGGGFVRSVDVDAYGAPARMSGVCLRGRNSGVTAAGFDGADWNTRSRLSWFPDPVTGKDSAGIGHETLSVGGALRYEGKSYSLAESGEALSFPVGASSNDADYVINNFAGGNTDLAAVESDNTISIYRNTAVWSTKTLPAGWEIEGVGDYNGDGVGDFLLEYSSSGTVGAWVMQTNGSNGYLSIGTAAPAVWEVKYSGDFNGDGVSDILLEADDYGTVGSWLIDSAGAVTYRAVGNLSDDWDIAGVGDFNGDNLDDVLLQNEDSGVIGTWLLHADGAYSWQSIGTPGADWDIAGVGDFNGDGISDLLLEADSWNTQGTWLLNSSASVSGWRGFGAYDSSVWDFEGVGDFNGDGTDDLLYSADSYDTAGARLIANGAVNGWLAVV